MKKKRILIISDKFFPSVGGIEVMSLFLAKAFNESDYTVKLITWTEDDENSKFSFEIIRNPSLKELFKSFTWSDVVLENNPTLRLSWPLLLFHKPLITVLHTWINRTNGKKSWQDLLKRLWLKKRTNKIISVSNALKNNSNIAAEVIMNPYDANIFKISKHIKREFDFVFLGRLVSDKGVYLAINLIDKLLKDGFDTQLTIIGEGPEGENLKELSIKKNIDKKIIFTGTLTGNSLVETLNQHKFILIPSIWDEPFGLVALEGMACGCIPIVSNRGGLPEAIGNAGISFDPDDNNSFYNVTKEVLTNKVIRTQLLSSANNHLKKHHPNVIGQKYIELVNNVLNTY